MKKKTQLYDEQIDEGIFRKCAMDLCGAPKNSPNAYILDFNFDQYVSDGVMKKFEEIEGKVKELAEAEIAKNNKLIEEFKKKYKNVGVKLDFSKWEPWEYETFTYWVFDEHLEVRVDKSLEHSKRLSITVKHPKRASNIFKRALDSYAKKKKYVIENSLSDGVYQNFYTFEEAKVKIKNKFDQMWKIFSDEKIKNPDFMESDQENLKIIEALREKIVSVKYDDIFDLGETAHDLHDVNDRILFEKNGEWPGNENFYTCEEDKCRLGIQEYLNNKDYKKMYEQLEINNNDKSLISDKLSYCKSQLAMNGLKDYDKEDFKKNIPEIKNLFLKNVFKDYKSSSQKDFELYLNNELNLSFEGKKPPRDIDKFLKKIKNSYKSFKEKSPLKINYTEKDAKFFVSELLGKLRGDAFKPLRKLYMCDSSDFVAWDGFATKKMLAEDGTGAIGADTDLSKDNIFISMFSCSHHQHGQIILAHELGHALSWAYADKKLSEASYDKYKKIRQCATRLYTDGGNMYDSLIFSHEGDMRRTEEDTADLISYIAYPNKETLFECSLLEPSSNGETYKNVILNNKNDVSNGHSTSFMRILQEAIHKKKKLSKSCQNIIDKYKDKYRFEPCF